MTVTLLDSKKGEKAPGTWPRTKWLDLLAKVPWGIKENTSHTKPYSIWCEDRRGSETEQHAGSSDNNSVQHACLQMHACPQTLTHWNEDLLAKVPWGRIKENTSHKKLYSLQCEDRRGSETEQHAGSFENNSVQHACLQTHACPQALTNWNEFLVAKIPWGIKENTPHKKLYSIRCEDRRGSETEQHAGSFDNNSVQHACLQTHACPQMLTHWNEERSLQKACFRVLHKWVISNQ